MHFLLARFDASAFVDGAGFGVRELQIICLKQETLPPLGELSSDPDNEIRTNWAR